MVAASVPSFENEYPSMFSRRRWLGDLSVGKVHLRQRLRAVIIGEEIDGLPIRRKAGSLAIRSNVLVRIFGSPPPEGETATCLVA